MKYSDAAVKVVRTTKVTDMIARRENRKNEKSRLWALRQEMLRKMKNGNRG